MDKWDARSYATSHMSQELLATLIANYGEATNNTAHDQGSLGVRHVILIYTLIHSPPALIQTHQCWKPWAAEATHIRRVQGVDLWFA